MPEIGSEETRGYHRLRLLLVSEVSDLYTQSRDFDPYVAQAREKHSTNVISRIGKA